MVSLERSQPDRYILDATYKVVWQSLDVSNHLYLMKPQHDLFPQHTQLHLSQTISHTAVNAKPKGDMSSSIRSINDELVWVLNT